MALGKGAAYSTSVLDLLLNATPIANIADDTATDPLTSLYVSLHTASPEAGNQTTSECAYTGYARVAVSRNAGTPKWTVAAGAAENAEAIDFAECTALSSTATHFAVGSLTAGAGVVYYCGQLTAPLAISAGITPSFAAGALDITED